MSNKRDIRLPEVNRSELLTEVTRAYMHGAMPSTLFSRIIKGVEAFLEECDLNKQDRAFMGELHNDLCVRYNDWRAKEDATYSKGEK